MCARAAWVCTNVAAPLACAGRPRKWPAYEALDNWLDHAVDVHVSQSPTVRSLEQLTRPRPCSDPRLWALCSCRISWNVRSSIHCLCPFLFPSSPFTFSLFCFETSCAHCSLNSLVSSGFCFPLFFNTMSSFGSLLPSQCQRSGAPELGRQTAAPGDRRKCAADRVGTRAACRTRWCIWPAAQVAGLLSIGQLTRLQRRCCAGHRCA